LAGLVDGISKMRWLCGEKEDYFVVDEIDCSIAEDIFSVVVSSWVTNPDDFMKLPKNARVKHLTQDVRSVYDYVSNYGGCERDELNVKFGLCDIQLDLLTRSELVYEFDRKFYAFWHGVVRERRLELGRIGQNSVSQWDSTDL
jgi:hypothetical protein